MWYNLDIRKLGVQLLPTFLRQKVLVTYLRVLIKPLDDVYYQWKMYRRENLYNLEHNGQKTYLRAVLNDRYDSDLRRIQIENVILKEDSYIYTDDEINKQPWLAKFLDMILFRDSELSDSAVDFFVRVPANIHFKDYEMAYLIDYYKLASKRYKIVTL